MAATTAAELGKLMDTAERACADASNGDKAQVERAMDTLNLLKRTPVTTSLLVDTQGGKRMKKLSKHSEPGIAAAAGDVVESWKEAVKKEKSGGENKPSNSQGSSLQKQLSSSQPEDSADGIARSSSFPQTPVEQRPPARTGNDKRDKARSLLAEALKLALCDVPEGDTAEVAEAVEGAMMQQAGSINQAYFNKCRSLNYNLKKADNPDLRRDVLSGLIPPERLVTMSAEDMAPARVREENQKIRDKMMFEVQRGGQQKATTDQFQCSKCKQRKATFYQLQTRSADEPMTTFVTCVNCGKRWKFC